MQKKGLMLEVNLFLMLAFYKQTLKKINGLLKDRSLNENGKNQIAISLSFIS